MQFNNKNHQRKSNIAHQNMQYINPKTLNTKVTDKTG